MLRYIKLHYKSFFIVA